MATKNPPVKNAAFTFRIVLFAQSDNQIKTTPTIAAGDFKVSVDGGALANPGTLPSESPASSGQVLITLTADEMNGDEIVVRWIDASGDEWHSGAVVLHTVASGKQFDDLATATAISALNNISTAQVNTEVDKALADIHLDHLLAVADSDTPVDNSIIAKFAAGGDWSNFDAGDDSLASISNEIENNVNAVLNDLTTTIGTPAGASVSADIAAIEAQTDDIGVAGAGLTALGDTRIANLDATISSRAAAATLTTIGARIGSFTGSGVNTILGFLQAIMRSDATLPSDIGGTFDDATDSLEAIRNRGDAAWTTGSGATAGDIADAVWDEAIAGHLSAGSTGAALNSIDADEIVDALEAALAAVSSVTVVSTVAGATATVYQYATWDATFTLSGTPGLTAYENLIFAVKRYPSDTDAESVLLVKSSGGLIYIGQAAATASSYGTLTADSATEFTVYVDVAEVAAKIAANFSGAMTWTLKGVETSTTPDEAIVIATGSWYIEPGFVRSIT